MTRIHRIALDAWIGETLNVTRSAIGGMIEHCVDIMNKRCERHAGKKYEARPRSSEALSCCA